MLYPSVLEYLRDDQGPDPRVRFLGPNTTVVGKDTPEPIAPQHFVTLAEDTKSPSPNKDPILCDEPASGIIQYSVDAGPHDNTVNE
jgi:hypothetical protein